MNKQNLGALALVAVLCLLPAFTFADSNIDSIVFLGFDGADSALCEKWMDAGKLPHLKQLRDGGGYARLLPTNPPQTPVSWAAFATGLDPGETTIFDFLKRKKGTYFPTFAMIEETSETFLWGEKNSLYMGAFASAGLFALVFVFLFVFRVKFSKALIVGLVLGAAAFFPVFHFVGLWIPDQMPSAINNRQGLTMWKAVTEQCGQGDCGQAQVFRVPDTFPPQDIAKGWIIPGLGVPDIRGRVGTPAYYTTDPTFIPDSNQYSIELFKLPEFDDTAKTHIYGPQNKLFPKNENYPKRFDLPLFLKREGDSRVTLTVQEQSVTLSEGEWTPWMEFHFKINPVITLKGISRFYLLSAKPLKLNLMPINFHPGDSPVKLSSPKSFSNELFRRFGYYKTIGWVTDTWSLDQELSDEAEFLSDMYHTVDKDQEIMRAFLNSDTRAKLYVQVYEFTDRIGHLFWRFMDPDHPRYNAAEAARWGPEMLKAYQRMDDIVGEAMDAIDPQNTLLVVASDHGFSTWHKSINYNTWLIKEGFMTLKGQDPGPKSLEDLFDGGEFFENVDWSQTRAYAMGLGNIYINLEGREPQGSVPFSDYDSVRNDIIEQLEAFVDPETGLNPVRKVYRREDIYRSFDEEITPDLRAGNNTPYRVSWQTSLGAAPAKLFLVNDKKWSGDHCSLDPAVVKGILFANRPVTDDPAIIDLYPSFMEALDIKVEGRIGTSIFAEAGAS